jgi:hypothetical protein
MASALDVGLAGAAAFLTQVVLAIVKPELALTHWAPTQGGIAGWAFIASTRAIFPPGPKNWSDAVYGEAVFLEDIRWKAQEFEIGVRLRNMNIYVAAALVALAGAIILLRAHTPQGRYGSALMIAGVAYMIYQVFRSGLPKTMPHDLSVFFYSDFYRQELERQVKFLNRVRYWIFGSLLPASLLLMAGSRVYGYVYLLCIFELAEFNLRAMEKFRRESDQIEISLRNHGPHA